MMSIVNVNRIINGSMAYNDSSIVYRLCIKLVISKWFLSDCKYFSNPNRIQFKTPIDIVLGNLPTFRMLETY